MKARPTQTDDPDIFLSYSRIDDHEHYIGHLHEELTQLLNIKLGKTNPKRIFFDQNHLDENRNFPDELKEAASKAKLLIAVITPGYKNSKWCRLERDNFLKKYKGNAKDVCYLIDLGTLEIEDRPKEFSELTGFNFYSVKKNQNKTWFTIKSSGFRTTCDDIATKITKELQSRNTLATSDRGSVKGVLRPKQEPLIEEKPRPSLRNKLQSPVESLPAPFAQLLKHAIVEYTASKQKEKREIAADLARSAVNGIENFLTAISLAEFWRNIERIPRSGFIQLRKQMFEDSKSINQSLTSSDKLQAISNLCLRHIESAGVRVNGKKRSLCVSELSTLSRATTQIQREFSDRIPTLLSATNSIEKVLVEKKVELQTIQQIFDNIEITIPTSINKSANKLSIQSCLFFDFESWKWKTTDLKLTLEMTESDSLSEYWISTVTEKVSPLLIKKQLFADAKSGVNKIVHTDCDEICSLFPFVFTKIHDDTHVDFFLYDDVVMNPGVALEENIDTVGFVRLSSNGSRKVAFQKQQQYAPISAFEKFISSVMHRSGQFNLSITPQSIDTQHEYVLCEKIEGRENEIAEMDNWINDQSESTVFCWEAFGGDGKSALVNSWLFLRPETLELLRDNGFEGALWADFYQPNFGLCDFARCFLNKINSPHAQMSDTEVLGKFFEEVKTKQYIFVLDGVERLLRSEELSDKEISDLVNKNGKLPEEFRYCRSFSDEPAKKRYSPSINDDFFVRLGEIPSCASRFLMTTRFCPSGIDLLAKNYCAIVKILEPITTKAAECIWWTAAGRKPVSAAEESSVREAIELLTRHPLTIRILASSVGEHSFDDWKRNQKLRCGGETPFDEEIRGEIPDSRTRCSEVIWVCGQQLGKEEADVLKVIDRNYSGSVYLKDLQENTSVVSSMGQLEFTNKFRSIVQKLAKNGWIGLSQGDLLNLHPMVRQFAKDARDNRGYSKNQSLSPAQYDNMLQLIDAKLNLPTPLYDSAWKQILRREPWNACMRLNSSKIFTYASIEKLAKLMTKFLPSETSETYPLPRLSNRNDQCHFLYQLGSLQSHLGNYQKAMEFLEFAMCLGDLLGAVDIVNSCESTILWVSLYEGDLETAENNSIDSGGFSPINEVCLALRGARSKEFSDIDPSLYVFPQFTDRRWLFQSLAEACFWRRDFERSKVWIDILKNFVDSLAVSEYDGPQTQKMWEDWTFGVSLAEDYIQSELFSDKQLAVCLEYFERATNSAIDARYSIVASLSLAFEIRLLSFCLNKHPRFRSRFFKKLDRFNNDPFLQRPHAVALVRIAEIREELNRTGKTNRNLLTFYEGISAKGREFFFGLNDLSNILKEYEFLDFPFRAQLDAQLNAICTSPSLVVERYDNPNACERNTLEVRETQEEGDGASKVKKDNSEWSNLNGKYGKEISYFKSVVHFFGGNESDFEDAISVHTHGSSIDPLAAVVEIVCKEIEGGNSSLFIDRTNIQNYLTDIRELGFEDFNRNVPIAKRFWEKTIALQSSTTGRRRLDSLLKDSQRLFCMGDFSEPVMTTWRDRVAIHLFHEASVPYVLFPFFETILMARVSLTELVKGIRIPSKGCYRASLYRMRLEHFLPRLSRLSVEEQDDLRFWRAMYLCGWGGLDDERKKSWERYSSTIPRHSAMKVVEELRKMSCTLGDFLACVESNKSDSLQGNLSFLKYKRRTDFIEKLNKSEKELLTDVSTSVRISLEQQIKFLRSKLPFWEDYNEQTDN
jgi:hypothetical protein